jgi:hypothetical protein
MSGLSATDRNSIRLEMREIKSCIYKYWVWWIYLFRKKVRKVKDIANTDKLLVAGIAKPQSFLDITGCKWCMYGFRIIII